MLESLCPSIYLASCLCVRFCPMNCSTNFNQTSFGGVINYHEMECHAEKLVFVCLFVFTEEHCSQDKRTSSPTEEHCSQDKRTSSSTEEHCGSPVAYTSLPDSTQLKPDFAGFRRRGDSSCIVFVARVICRVPCSA